MMMTLMHFYVSNCMSIPVIHHTCSYGGMLTAWIRFKYPNLVDGGLAGSAPIYYTEGLVPRTAFFEKVTNVRTLKVVILCRY